MSNNYWNAEEFYPTPETLLEKMTANLQWNMINTILEPSAGKGDILDFLDKKSQEARYEYKLRDRCEVDCIEINPTLQATLRGKNYHVIAGDFLSYQTFFHYDLIIMNPPFSNGATHLLKAISMQENGGAIICILNAETIKNPYTNERKALCAKLDELDADIEFCEEEFASAENKTNVEVAIIKINIPGKPLESDIYKNLKKKFYEEGRKTESTALESSDYIQAIIDHYNLEIEMGLKLIREYKALIPYMLNDVKEKNYSRPLLEMRLLKGSEYRDLSENKYIKAVRRKYWSALFADQRFTGKMTSNLLDEYTEQINKLDDYDFSAFNILQIQKNMAKEISKGVEECIIQLFDKLSCQYSYSNEFGKNVHYYNGWSTNKSWVINKKVIIPFYGMFSTWTGMLNVYECSKALNDIEKVLDYLDIGQTFSVNTYEIIKKASESGNTRNIRLKHFTVSIYKKGTCHITFHDEELLKRFNIFGSQKKGWLPQHYGKKAYETFNEEERAVIDSFQGKEEYEKVFKNPEQWIFDPVKAVPMLETVA